MKTYEEMAQSVLTRIEEYEVVKSEKKRRLKKTALICAPLCAALAVGVFGVSVYGRPKSVPAAHQLTAVTSAVNPETDTDKSAASSEKKSAAESETEISGAPSKDVGKNEKPADKVESVGIVNIPYSEDTENDSTDISTQDGEASGVINTPYVSSDTDSAADASVSDEERGADVTEPEDGAVIGDVDDAMGMIVKDGVTYLQIFGADEYNFTLDENIGYANDFEGYYRYIKDVVGEVYTVKESPDVLVVKLSNGGTVVLARNGQIIVNGVTYFSTMLDPNVYAADEFLGHVSDFETINVPYRSYTVELSPNDEVYTVADKGDEAIFIRQENGNEVVFCKI